MKTFLVCILAAVIASSNGLIFSLLGGLNQLSAPQELLHHHHHHHEVLHKSVPVEQHSLPVVNYAHRPIDLQPQYVRIIKVIHEEAPALEYGGHHGYAPAPVLTKVLQPIVNKNFIQSRHEHHYHQLHHGGPGPAAEIHHQQW